MRVKYSDLMHFDQIYATISDKSLPLRAAYKMAKLYKLSDEELKFYRDKLASYIDLYADRNEEGTPKMSANNGIMIKPDKVAECNQKIRELEEMMIDVPTVKFQLEELESLDFTVDEMTALLPFIDE